jgi:hypothetical protein
MPRKSSKPATLHPKQRRFLRSFEDRCSVRSAAHAAGISPRTHYRWLSDAKYATAFEKSKLVAGDVLEAECVRRGVRGWDETVYYQGRPCGTVHRYDNKLLMFLLRCMLPERYGDRAAIPARAAAAPPAQPKVKVVYADSAQAGAQIDGEEPAGRSAVMAASAMDTPAPEASEEEIVWKTRASLRKTEAAATCLKQERLAS